jgi:hypothetical protein
LFEVVEVDVDQPEDRGLLARLFNERVEMLVQGKAVVDVGEQIPWGSPKSGHRGSAQNRP